MAACFWVQYPLLLPRRGTQVAEEAVRQRRTVGSQIGFKRIRRTDMFYVYVQKNLKNKLYKGHTARLTNRRIEHLLGWSPYSKRFGPSKLVYFEVFDSKQEAIRREKFLKSGAGREFLKKKGL